MEERKWGREKKGNEVPAGEAERRGRRETVGRKRGGGEEAGESDWWVVVKRRVRTGRERWVFNHRIGRYFQSLVALLPRGP